MANGTAAAADEITSHWRTRPDPFAAVWATEIEPRLRADSEGRLQAITGSTGSWSRIPGSLQPGQLRMLQQRVRVWRERHPPDQQVFFEDRGARARRGIDFIDATDLGVTIAG